VALGVVAEMGKRLGGNGESSLDAERGKVKLLRLHAGK